MSNEPAQPVACPGVAELIAEAKLPNPPNYERHRGEPHWMIEYYAGMSERLASALERSEAEAAAMREWIKDAPHRSSCKLANIHVTKQDECSCGRDSLLGAYDAARKSTNPV